MRGDPGTPHFVQPQGEGDRVVIGSRLGPTTNPTGMVRTVGDTLAYESLFTTLGPNGQAVSYVNPGTFGITVRAGRGR